MRVIIAGAGDVGLQLLASLAGTREHEIVVVEIDEALADDVADDHDVLVINGDASDPGILEKAQIDEADALVAVTGSDPINTVIAMLGHRKHVGRIVVKLTSNSLRGALDEIGITDVVAPTMAAVAHIEAALHGEPDRQLSELIPGGLQMAEIQVGPHAGGVTTQELDLPGDVALIAVVHGDGASIVRPETRLEEGDLVLVVAETEDALGRCRSLLEQR